MFSGFWAHARRQHQSGVRGCLKGQALKMVLACRGEAAAVCLPPQQGPSHVPVDTEGGGHQPLQVHDRAFAAARLLRSETFSP